MDGHECWGSCGLGRRGDAVRVMVGTQARPHLLKYSVTVLCIPSLAGLQGFRVRRCPPPSTLSISNRTHPSIRRTETATEAKLPDICTRRMKGVSSKTQLEGREQGETSENSKADITLLGRYQRCSPVSGYSWWHLLGFVGSVHCQYRFHDPGSTPARLGLARGKRLPAFTSHALKPREW